MQGQFHHLPIAKIGKRSFVGGNRFLSVAVIHLPGISGIEAMKILRADPTTAHIPVIAISANALSADIKLAMKAGFFQYLTKPLRLDEFMSVLDVALDISNSKLTIEAAKALTKG